MCSNEGGVCFEQGCTGFQDPAPVQPPVDLRPAPDAILTEDEYRCVPSCILANPHEDRACELPEGHIFELPDAKGYVTRDSGDRIVYDSGMVRDTQTGKARFDLLIPEGVPYEQQFLTRVAQLMARGAEKYGERNWEKATDDVELGRAKASAVRHLMQWIADETDEDHAAAVVFNLNEAETIKYKQRVAAASIVTTEVDQ